MLRSPSPEPPPVVQEVVLPEQFTVSQLLNLYQQVSLIHYTVVGIVTNFLCFLSFVTVQKYLLEHRLKSLENSAFLFK